MNFYDQFVSMCAKSGKKPSQVAKELNISKATVSNWKMRGSTPTDVTKAKIGNYFGYTFEFVPEIEIPATNKGDGLSEADAQLISWFRSLPQEKQKAILTSLDAPEGLA